MNTNAPMKVESMHYSPRKVPMRVLALGLSRTGTESLQKALVRLGYIDTYHGYTVAWDRPEHCRIWLDALDAKYRGKGTQFGRPEFDALLGNYQACSDIPVACFATELIAAYPEAKIILTNRDVDSWHQSVLGALLSTAMEPWSIFVGWLAFACDSPRKWTRPMFLQAFEDYFEGNFRENGKRIYQEHYDRVRALVPPEKLLEYQVEEGWEPLCKFLGAPIPDQPFPSGNKLAETKSRINSLVALETTRFLDFAFGRWIKGGRLRVCEAG